MSRAEVSRSGWLFASFLIGPMALLVIFWWQVYLTFDAVMKVLPVAISLGSVFGWLMYRRSVWLVARGLHPYFSISQRLPLKNVVAGFLGVILTTWGWGLVLLALVVLPSTDIQKRSFTISEVKDCTRKCLGCPTQVELSNWVGADHVNFCAEGLSFRPRVGEQVQIRGRFADIVQYVLELDRVRG